jgi:hypothetical protein
MTDMSFRRCWRHWMRRATVLADKGVFVVVLARGGSKGVKLKSLHPPDGARPIAHLGPSVPALDGLAVPRQVWLCEVAWRRRPLL